MLLRTLVRASRLTKAVELYDDMKASGIAPLDIATYSVMVKALVDQHDLERALQLLEDLKAAGLNPDDIILTHLLEGCRHAGDHALGKRLFAEMVGSRLKPSEYTLVTMLKLHGRCGAHKEAYDLVVNWPKLHSSKPSVIHYTCLMSGCLRTRNYDQAWAAYTLMCESGIQPDETTVTTLLPAMITAQRWDSVLHLVRQALKGPEKLAIPSETLNCALSQLLTKAGTTRTAEQLRDLMLEADIPVTSRNVKRMPG